MVLRGNVRKGGSEGSEEAGVGRCVCDVCAVCDSWVGTTVGPRDGEAVETSGLLFVAILNIPRLKRDRSRN